MWRGQCQASFDFVDSVVEFVLGGKQLLRPDFPRARIAFVVGRAVFAVPPFEYVVPFQGVAVRQLGPFVQLAPFELGPFVRPGWGAYPDSSLLPLQDFLPFHLHRDS